MVYTANEKKILIAYARAKKVMSKRFDIPLKEMPTLIISQKEDRSKYSRGNNLIYIPANERNIGNTVGEELGHYVRDRLTDDVGDSQTPPIEKKNKEQLTHEFFGFLGQRILYADLTPKERTLFPEGLPRQSRDYEKNLMADSRSDRQYLQRSKKDFKSLMKSEGDFWKQDMNELDRLKEEATDPAAKLFFRNLQNRALHDVRVDKRKAEFETRNAVREKYGPKLLDTIADDRKHLLTHARAYRFASEIDLAQVDVKKLYALPEKEVRKEFFRAEPNYGFLQARKERLEERKKKPGGLEAKVAIVLAFILFTAGAVSLSITGYAVAESGASNFNNIGIFFFLAGLGLLAIKKD